MKRNCPLQLCFRVGRSLKAWRKRQIRTCAPGNVGIDQKGQDRMVEGACGQLDLSRLSQAAVPRDNLGNGLELQRENFLFCMLGKTPVLASQFADARILSHRSITEPRKIVPGLKVQKLLGRK